jgi:hypothetical protein
MLPRPGKPVAACFVIKYVPPPIGTMLEVAPHAASSMPHDMNAKKVDGFIQLPANVLPGCRVAALLTISGRLLAGRWLWVVIGLHSSGLAGVRVSVALGAVIVGVGVVGGAAHVSLNVSAVFCDVWSYIGLSKCRHGAES